MTVKIIRNLLSCSPNIMSTSTTRNSSLKLIKEICRGKMFYAGQSVLRRKIDLTSNLTKLTIGGNKTLLKIIDGELSRLNPVGINFLFKFFDGRLFRKKRPARSQPYWPQIQ